MSRDSRISACECQLPAMKRSKAVLTLFRRFNMDYVAGVSGQDVENHALQSLHSLFVHASVIVVKITQRLSPGERMVLGYSGSTHMMVAPQGNPEGASKLSLLIANDLAHEECQQHGPCSSYWKYVYAYRTLCL